MSSVSKAGSRSVGKKTPAAPAPSTSRKDVKKASDAAGGPTKASRKPPETGSKGADSKTKGASSTAGPSGSSSNKPKARSSGSNAGANAPGVAIKSKDKLGTSTGTSGSKSSSSSGLGSSKSVSSSSLTAKGNTGSKALSGSTNDAVSKPPKGATSSGNSKSERNSVSNSKKVSGSTSGSKKEEKGPARSGGRAAGSKPPPAAASSKTGASKGFSSSQDSEELIKPKPKKEGVQKSPKNRIVQPPTPVEEMSDNLDVEVDEVAGSGDSMEAVAASVTQDDIEEEDGAVAAVEPDAEDDYEDDFEDYDDDFEEDDEDGDDPDEEEEESEEEEEDEFADMRNENQRNDDEGISDVEHDEAVGARLSVRGADEDPDDEVDSGHSSGHFTAGATAGGKHVGGSGPRGVAVAAVADADLVAAITAENERAADFAAQQSTTQQRRNALRPQSGLAAVEELRHKAQDSGAHRTPLKGQVSSDKVDPKTEPKRSHYDFSAAKKRQQSAIVAGRTARRGAELMDIISLEASSADLFEMAPSDYEAYIRRFGRSNTKQIGISTSDDCEVAEIQTDPIRYCSKWVQCPPTFKPHTVTAASENGGTQEENIPSISREDLLGVGVGFDPLCCGDADPSDESSCSRTAFTFDGFTNSGVDGSPSPAFDQLGTFVESAGRLVLALLQEERGEDDGVTSKITSAGNKALLSEIPFGAGLVPIGPDGDGKLAGTPVTKVLFSPFASSLLLTCHEGSDVPRTGSDVLSEESNCLAVWNLLEAAVPRKVLRSRGLVTSMCFGPGQHAPAVLAGTRSGAICLWDTSESSFLHEAFVVERGDISTLDGGEFKKQDNVPVKARVGRDGGASEDGEDADSGINEKGSIPEASIKSSRNELVTYTVRAPTYVTLSKGAKTSSLFKPGAAVVALRIVPNSYAEGDGRSSFQVVSLNEGGVVEFWMATVLPSCPDISQLESDPGLAFWAKMKLSKLSQVYDLAQEISNDPSTLVSDPFKGADFKCTDLAVQLSDANRMYVCTDSRIGVAHVSRTGGKAFPRSYKPDEDGACESTCVASFPFGHHFLLVGTNDGAVKLFNGANDRPITYWNAADYVPIVKIQWSPFRPLVFFALDENGRFYAWDLNQGDLSPIYCVQLKSHRIIDFSLGNFTESDGPVRPPHFALALSDGRVLVSKFGDSLLAAGGSTLEEELGKFLHYVSIL